MNALVKTETSALAISETEMVRVLSTSLYPGAAIESIKMVISYCKAAGLDPMQKPVHIVPMWNAKLGKMVDVIMPGVGLYRTQASRTGRFAGQSEPEFGPMVTELLGGQQITFPDWARVTVKKQMDNGQIAEFTAKEYWMENYAVKGGKERSIAPNAMWAKRPRGQIGKCAAAQALRLAFPEMGAQPTAEEMEGKAMHIDEQPAPEFDYLDPRPYIDAVTSFDIDIDVLAYWKSNSAKFAKQPADYQAFKDAVLAHRTDLSGAVKAASKEVAQNNKTFEQVMAMLTGATNIDALYVAGDWIGGVEDADGRAMLTATFEEIKTTLEAA